MTDSPNKNPSYYDMFKKNAKLTAEKAKLAAERTRNTWNDPKNVEYRKSLMANTKSGINYAAKQAVSGMDYAAKQTASGMNYAAKQTASGINYAAKQTASGMNYAANTPAGGNRYDIDIHDEKKKSWFSRNAKWLIPVIVIVALIIVIIILTTRKKKTPSGSTTPTLPTSLPTSLPTKLPTSMSSAQTNAKAKGLGGGANASTAQATAKSAGIGSGANAANIQNTAKSAGVSQSGIYIAASEACSGGECINGTLTPSGVKNTVKSSNGGGLESSISNLISAGVDIPFDVLNDLGSDFTGVITGMFGGIGSIFSAM